MFFRKYGKKTGICGLCLAMVLGLSACTDGSAGSEKTGGETNNSDSASVTEQSVDENNESSLDSKSYKKDMFTDRDLEGTYDESKAVKIDLDEKSLKTYEGAKGVDIDDKTVKITAEGIYVFSGSLSDGQIQVDAADDAKIQLVLDGVSLSSDSTAPIYVKNAKKVFVTLAKDSVNSLAVTGAFEKIDDNNIDAVIFSKDDLTLNGSGSLEVKAEEGHGIVSKDDLVLTGGSYTVDAQKKALDAHNSVRIADGKYKLTAGTDGIHAADKDKNKGFIYIAGGEIEINAGDDGAHALSDLTVDGGMIAVAGSYEGLEGNTVTINGGDIDVKSSDDGLNAAGGNDGSGSKGPGGGGDPFATDESCMITITGGKLHVDAEGDGIDSNGSIEVTGGRIFVEGPQNDGNASLDIGGSSEAVITGGVFMATGSSGMAEQFSSNSTQGVILANVETTTGKAELKDADGKVIVSQNSSKQYNCVQISTPDIKKGETYTLTCGGSDTAITMDSLIYGDGNGMGGHAGPGGHSGNMKPDDMDEGYGKRSGKPGGGPGGYRPDKGNMGQENEPEGSIGTPT